MPKIKKHIPNSMTLFNILIGFAAIFYSIRHEYATAGGLILMSVLVDSFDGYIARMLKATSRFGSYMDTVSDFLAFSLATSILMVNQFNVNPLVAALFVMASVARLIYFMKTKNSTHFFGVPTTVAGGLLATISMLNPKMDSDYDLGISMTLLVLILSALMLSKKKYYRIEIKKRRTLTFTIAVMVSLLAVNARLFIVSLLCLFLFYILFGWMRFFRKKEVDSIIPE
jgi:CDP-diacylglycerol---serine O-phosphatidyltransferase